jgi:hypothetical protein
LLVRLHIRQLVHKVHKLDWLFGTDEKHHPVTIGVPLWSTIFVGLKHHLSLDIWSKNPTLSVVVNQLTWLST